MSRDPLASQDAIIEMERLPPRWLDISDEVTTTLNTIQSQMSKLEPLHAKHVLPGFEDDNVKKREEQVIERMTSDITRGFVSCQRAIKKVERMVKEESAKRGSISRAEETMARNLQIQLATRVGEMSTLFRKKQSVYLRKMRTLNGMASPLDRSAVGTPRAEAANPYSDPSLMESMEDRSFGQSTLQQTALKRRAGVHENAIAQREKEIEDIAQGIIELANIFQELQTMVIDQGTMLDRIDYNVERMAVDVKGADKELKVATGYQKKTTKRKIILLLILVVVGMFILLLVKPKKGASVVQPAPPTQPEPPVQPVPPNPPAAP